MWISLRALSRHGPLHKLRRVLQWVLKKQGHVTRLDCALDDRTMLVPLTTIKDAIETGQCVTRADRMQIIASGFNPQRARHGETLYLGSPQSQTLLRIYDKRPELQSPRANGCSGRTEYDGNWNSSKSVPQLCGQCLGRSSKKTIGWNLSLGLLRSYVDFRDTTREEEEEDRLSSSAACLGMIELTDGFRKGRLVVEKEDTRAYQK